MDCLKLKLLLFQWFSHAWRGSQLYLLSFSSDQGSKRFIDVAEIMVPLDQTYHPLLFFAQFSDNATARVRSNATIVHESDVLIVDSSNQLAGVIVWNGTERQLVAPNFSRKSMHLVVAILAEIDLGTVVSSAVLYRKYVMRIDGRVRLTEEAKSLTCLRHWLVPSRFC